MIITSRVRDDDGATLLYATLMRSYARVTRHVIMVEPSTMPQDLSMGSVSTAELIWAHVMPYSDTVDTSDVTLARNGSVERIPVADLFFVVGTDTLSLDIVAPDGAIVDLFVGGA